MSPDIYIHLYSLKSKYVLNSTSERASFEGALIRVNGGFGCIHPWQELGDPGLGDLIDSLRVGDASQPLIRNALGCARVDGEARRRGVNLFDGISVPKSHATLVNPQEQLGRAVEDGFTVVKMKAGRDLETEVQFLNHTVRQYLELRWRLDFNQACTREQFDKFLADLSEEVIERIDFFEDPCSPNENIDGVAVPMAIDKGVEFAAKPYSVAVVKPAVDDVEAICKMAARRDLKTVFTSYMDHPLGQSYAAYVAGVSCKKYGGLVDTRAGLMTHDLFEPNAFTEALGVSSPSWQSASGTGLGFDDLLEALDWEKLS